MYDIAPQASPALRERLDAGAPPRAIFSAVLEELGRRPPVVVVLEDLHWADAATLDLVKFLGRRIRQVPALLVLTYRDDEVGPRHPLRIVLGDLATWPAVRRVPLAPLSVAAVQTLAAGQRLDAAAPPADRREPILRHRGPGQPRGRHYDGPTPEAVRRVADRNKLPVDRITEVRVLDPYFYR